MVNRAVLHKKGQPSEDITPDVSLVITTLEYFHPLTAGIKDFFKKHCFSCSFRKGKLLLKTGQVCEEIYFIKKGAVRGFIKEGTKDITTWISVEREVVSSISSLDKKEPAMENMQAIENCELLALTWVDFQDLYIRFPEFNIVARKLLQKYYQDAERRAFIARITNAENKYRLFLTSYGHLANRIPLTYIASFLGITLETLSRVRKKLSLKK